MTEKVQFPGSVQEVFDGIRDLLAKGVAGPVRVIYVELGSAPAPAVVDDLPFTTATATGVAPGDPAYSVQWNLQGHAVIAYMAQAILQREDADAHQRLQAAINSDPDADQRGDIGELAMWPDRIKHPPQGAGPEYSKRGWIALGKQTQPMHFIDIPYRPGARGEPQLPPIAGTVLEGLPKYIKQLSAWPDARSGANALAFVLHFIGDIHQPLHCACLADDRYSPPNYDRGGNLVAWGTSEKNPPNLHALWDDSVAARGQDVFKQVEALLAKYPRSHFEHEMSTDLRDWALDSFALACKGYDRFLADAAYDSSTRRFASPSKTYRKWVMDVALERAALAAYRLADVLAEQLPALDAIENRPASSADGANGNGVHLEATSRRRRHRARADA